MTASLVVGVHPGTGAGPVRLGMRVDEVLAAMGEPEARHPVWDGSGETLYWHQSAFQVSLGRDARVADVQLCANGPVMAVLDGIDLLSTPADEVVALLSPRLGDGGYEEHGYSFTFHRARLGFWRQGLPDDDWKPDDYEQFREGRYWDTVSTWVEASPES